MWLASTVTQTTKYVKRVCIHAALVLRQTMLEQAVFCALVATISMEQAACLVDPIVLHARRLIVLPASCLIGT